MTAMKSSKSLAVQSFLLAFTEEFQKGFYCLGHFVAEHTSHMILSLSLISLVFITGLQRLTSVKDVLELYHPSDSQALLERNITESLFFPKYDSDFEISRFTRYEGVCFVFVSANDKGTILRVPHWKEVDKVDELIKNITAQDEDGEVFNFEEACAKWNGHCLENDILKLKEYMHDIEGGKTAVNYPVMLVPFVLPHFWGGIDVDPEEHVLRSSKYVLLTYWLKYGTPRDIRRARLFEEEFIQTMKNTNFTDIEVTFYTGRSLEDEITENTGLFVKFAYIPGIIMVIVCFLWGFSSDCVRNKSIINLMGLTTISVATGAAVGLLIYLGTPFATCSAGALLLIQSVGFADMFILLSVWKKTHVDDPVPKRLAETYSTCALPISVSALCNVIIFLIGTSSTVFMISNFCLIAGVAMMFSTFWLVTVFGALLCISGRLEAQGRHPLICVTVAPKAQEGKRNKICGWLTSPSTKSKDHFSPTDNPVDPKPSPVKTSCAQKLASIISDKRFCCSVVAVYCCYLSGAVYGWTTVNNGGTLTNVFADDSYAHRYFEVFYRSFRRYPYNIQVIINDQLTYTDPQTRKDLLKLHDDFNDMEFISNKYFLQSWIRAFYKNLERKKMNLTALNETAFIDYLKTNFLKSSPMKLDVRFNDDETRIVAARFVLQAVDVDPRREVEMLQAIRHFAANSKFNLTIYTPMAIFLEQQMRVPGMTLRSVLIPMAVTLILCAVLLPNPWYSCFIVFSLLSTEVGVIGYMALWGVDLDEISVLSIIMNIGITINYCIHAGVPCVWKNSDKDKMAALISDAGIPLLKAGITSLLSAIVFFFIPSYLYRVFAKVFYLGILFTLFHVILIIPVLLRSLGPGSALYRHLSGKNKSNIEVSERTEDKRHMNGTNNV